MAAAVEVAVEVASRATVEVAVVGASSAVMNGIAAIRSLNVALMWLLSTDRAVRRLLRPLSAQFAGRYSGFHYAQAPSRVHVRNCVSAAS